MSNHHPVSVTIEYDNGEDAVKVKFGSEESSLAMQLALAISNCNMVRLESTMAEVITMLCEWGDYDDNGLFPEETAALSDAALALFAAYYKMDMERGNEQA